MNSIDVSSDDELEEHSLIMNKLRKVWKSLSPPQQEGDFIGKWYAAIYAGKKQHRLIIGKVLGRFLIDEGGPVDKIRLQCLKPKAGSGTVLYEYPPHVPQDIWNFDLADIIYGLVSLTYRGSHQFNVPDYDDIFNLYKKACIIDRIMF